MAYRATGAERAKKYGAKAILVRSVASFSIYSVHTGMQSMYYIYIKQSMYYELY